MITKITMETEDIPTLHRCVVKESLAGKIIFDLKEPDQFNIEVGFDDFKAPKGVGITKDMTRFEVGKLFIELGMSILEESKCT